MTRRIVCLLCAVLLTPALPACESIADAFVESVEDTDVTVIWRGMKHAWEGEVHRTGRFGNWVEVNTDQTFPRDISAHHMARTGSVADTATFSVLYDVVQATHVRFVAGSEVIPIEVKERETRTINAHVSIPVSSVTRLEGKGTLAVLLNGFNLQVRDGELAKKLGTLELELSKPVLSLQHIEFDITGEVYMSCASTECDLEEGLSKQTLWYDLEVFYVVAAAQDDWMNVIEHASLSTDYDYESGSDVPESLGSLSGDALTPPHGSGYQTYTHGYNGFRFHVRKNETVFLPDPVPHLFKWKMWSDPVGNLSVDPTVNGQAFFAHSSNGITNLGHHGHATLRLDPVTLQFETGLKKECEWQDTRAFGNNTGNGAETYANEGVILDRGDFGCL